MNTFQLSVFGRGVAIDSDSEKAARAITAVYGSLAGGSRVNLRYSVRQKRPRGGGFTLKRSRQEAMAAADDGELVFLLENDMTIELQRQRRDLYFVHAAALEFRDRAILFAGASGSGKSTTTWGLLRHGFRYLSDELAAIKLDTMEVYPYPRALCLKQIPPGGYPLPDGTLKTAQTLHVPTHYLPAEVVSQPTRLAAIFFLEDFSGPAIHPMGKAAAATRLFSNALNPLAHKGDGLDAAIEIVKKGRCFRLSVGELPAICSLVKTTLLGLG